MGIEWEAKMVGDDILGFGKGFRWLRNDRLGVAREEGLRMAIAVIQLSGKRDTVLLFELLFQFVSFDGRFEIKNILVIRRFDPVRYFQRPNSGDLPGL